MPKLLIQRPESSKKKKAASRPARATSYDIPHSPWQKLIDSKRLEKKLSYRGLSEVLKVNPSVLWQWLHSKNGFPSPYAFTDRHMKLLSEELGIPLPLQREALDTSRRLYTAGDAPAVPMPSQDHFQQFITVLENDRRQTVSKAYVLNLAKTFYALGEAR